MLTPSLPSEAPAGVPVSAWRRIQAGMLVCSAAGAPRTGVLAAPAGPIVTGTTDPSMTYRIGPFVGATSRDGVGVEFVANAETDTVGTVVAPGSNSRIDVIWFRSRFPSLTDTGQTAPLFGVTSGTANANPQKPSIPAGAEELATAVVTSSDTNGTQTVVITQTARLTAYAGGTVMLRNQAEQNAWVAAVGAKAYRLDTKRAITRVATTNAPTGEWLPDKALFLARRKDEATQNFGVSGWYGLGDAFGTGAAEINDIGSWSPGALQIARAGVYRVGFNVRLQNTSSPMAAQVTKNSGSPDQGVLLDMATGAGNALSGSAVVPLAGGDVVRALVYTSVANGIDTVDQRGLQLSVELLYLT